MAGGHSLFNLPAHAFWRLRFNPLQVMLREQIGSISKIGLWQAGIHHSCVRAQRAEGLNFECPILNYEFRREEPYFKQLIRLGDELQ